MATPLPNLTHEQQMAIINQRRAEVGLPPITDLVQATNEAYPAAAALAEKARQQGYSYTQPPDNAPPPAMPSSPGNYITSKPMPTGTVIQQDSKGVTLLSENNKPVQLTNQQIEILNINTPQEQLNLLVKYGVVEDGAKLDKVNPDGTWTYISAKDLLAQKQYQESQKQYQESLKQFESNLKDAPSELQHAYKIGGIEGYNQYLRDNYTLLSDKQYILNNDLNQIKQSDSKGYDALMAGGFTNYQNYLNANYTKVPDSQSDGQYMLNSDLSAIKDKTPALYSILMSKGYTDYKNEHDRIVNELKPYETKYYANVATDIETGESYDVTNPLKPVKLDKISLETMPLVDGYDVHSLLSDGKVAKEDIDKIFGENFSSNYYKNLAQLRDKSITSQKNVIQYSGINNIPTNADEVTSYLIRPSGNPLGDDTDYYIITYKYNDKDYAIKLSPEQSKDVTVLQGIESKLGTPSKGEQIGSEIQKVVSSPEFILATVGVGGAIGEGVAFGSKTATQVATVVSKIPKPVSIPATVGMSGLNIYSGVQLAKSGEYSQALGSFGFATLPVVGLAMLRIPKGVKTTVIDTVVEKTVDTRPLSAKVGEALYESGYKTGRVIGDEKAGGLGLSLPEGTKAVNPLDLPNRTPELIERAVGKISYDSGVLSDAIIKQGDILGSVVDKAAVGAKQAAIDISNAPNKTPEIIDTTVNKAIYDYNVVADKLTSDFFNRTDAINKNVADVIGKSKLALRNISGLPNKAPEVMDNIINKAIYEFNSRSDVINTITDKLNARVIAFNNDVKSIMLDLKYSPYKMADALQDAIGKFQYDMAGLKQQLANALDNLHTQVRYTLRQAHLKYNEITDLPNKAPEIIDRAVNKAIYKSELASDRLVNLSDNTNRIVDDILWKADPKVLGEKLAQWVSSNAKNRIALANYLKNELSSGIKDGINDSYNSKNLRTIIDDIEKAIKENNVDGLKKAGQKLKDLGEIITDNAKTPLEKSGGENLVQQGQLLIDKPNELLKYTREFQKSDIGDISFDNTFKELVVGEEYKAGTKTPLSSKQLGLEEGTMKLDPTNPEVIRLVNEISKDNALLFELRNKGASPYDIQIVTERIVDNSVKLERLQRGVPEKIAETGKVELSSDKITEESVEDVIKKINQSMEELAKKKSLDDVTVDDVIEGLRQAKEKLPEKPITTKPSEGGGTQVAIKEKVEVKPETQKKTMSPDELEELMKKKAQEKVDAKPEEKTSTQKPNKTVTEKEIDTFVIPDTQGTPYYALVWENGQISVKLITPEVLIRGFVEVKTNTGDVLISKEDLMRMNPDEARKLARETDLEAYRKASPYTITYPYYKTATSLEPEVKPSPELSPQPQPIPEPIKLPQPQPEKEAIQPFVFPQPVPTPKPFPELQPQPEPQPEKTPIESKPVQTKTPLEPPKIPTSKGGQQLTPEKLNGAIVWRQGVKWELLPPRPDGSYHTEDLIHLDSPPPGTYKFATGKGSAYKTLQVIGGVPKKDAQVDLGWATVNISSKGKELTMSFTGGKEAVEDRWAMEAEKEAQRPKVYYLTSDQSKIGTERYPLTGRSAVLSEQVSPMMLSADAESSDRYPTNEGALTMGMELGGAENSNLRTGNIPVNQLEENEKARAWREENGEPPAEKITEKIPKSYLPKQASSIGLQKIEMPQYKSGDVRVYSVNGNYIRTEMSKEHPSAIEWTMGGHWLVYDYVPKNEVWIDNQLQGLDKGATVEHELKEVDAMIHGKDYASAHSEVANPAELKVRHNPEVLEGELEEAREEVAESVMPKLTRRERRELDKELRPKAIPKSIIRQSKIPRYLLEDDEDESVDSRFWKPRKYWGREIRQAELGNALK